jgi:hypothetical protein
MPFNFGPSSMSAFGRGMSKMSNPNSRRAMMGKRSNSGNSGNMGNYGMSGQFTPPPMTGMNPGSMNSFSPMMNNPNTGIAGGMMNGGLSPMWEKFNQNLDSGTMQPPASNNSIGGYGPSSGMIGGLGNVPGSIGNMYRQGRFQTMF